MGWLGRELLLKGRGGRGRRFCKGGKRWCSFLSSGCCIWRSPKSQRLPVLWICGCTWWDCHPKLASPSLLCQVGLHCWVQWWLPSGWWLLPGWLSCAQHRRLLRWYRSIACSCSESHYRPSARVQLQVRWGWRQQCAGHSCCRCWCCWPNYIKPFLRDSIDISADDSTVPDGNIYSHENISDDCCIGRHEDESFVVYVEIIEVHDIAWAIEGLGVLAGSLQALGGEEERGETPTETAQHVMMIQ